MPINFNVPISGSPYEKSFERQTEEAVNLLGSAIEHSNSKINVALHKANKTQCLLNCVAIEMQKTINLAKKAQETADQALEKPASPVEKPASSFLLCEFYYFRHPVLRAGFEAAYGGIITNANTSYPEAWEYLQTEEGKKLCTTEDEWQAMTQETWATLADGTKVGWDGIGGAPWYVVDTEKNTLRLPDLRGMYAEAAGFDDLEVGGVHGDAIRNIVGHAGTASKHTHAYFSDMAGAFSAYISGGMASAAVGTSPGFYKGTELNASRVVPTANKNQPRAWGALPCVYLGEKKG